jgi:membrane associated rhomboid family serine protease
VQWLCSLGGPGLAEAWFGLSRAGLRAGCLWQLLTYPFLHELVNPLGIAVTVVCLMMMGRDLENVIGPKHCLILFLSATILPGIANVLHSATEQVFGAWPAVFALSIACAEALPECRLSLPYGRVSVRYRFLGAALLAMLFTSWLVDWFPFGHSSAFANLIGAGIGSVYVHLLGFGCLLPGERGFRNWLRQRTHIAEMPARQYIMEFVDPILEKIHAEGLQRLSGSERRILQKARQKARRKV